MRVALKKNSGHNLKKMEMGLIGAGISKSRMPRLQAYFSDLCGIEMQYVLIDGALIDGFDPVREVLSRFEAGWNGVNVTHPYKQTIWLHFRRPLIAEHDKIGSYNTLKFGPDAIYGANTDFTGFMRAYRSRLGDASPGAVVICGAGGVGRAVALALVELNASKIKIYDPNEQYAASLRETLEQRGISAEALGTAQLARAMHEADGLVNCSALGMHNHPGTAFPDAEINGQKWAFDAVYTPVETSFLQTCRCRGLTCITGFDLWIYQGIDAFKLFTGIDLDLTDTIRNTALGWLD